MNPLDPRNRSAAATILAVLAIVIFAALGGNILKALADGPPQQVIANVKTIEANQKILADTREAHEQFVQAKADNERLERENNQLGWQTDWKTLNPVKIETGF